MVQVYAEGVEEGCGDRESKNIRGTSNAALIQQDSL